MKVLFLISALLISSLILFSCKKDNPVKPKESPQAIINLTLEDVSCTEVWIKLTAENLSIPAEVEILKDSLLTETIALTSTDTILYVDSLFPNKIYSFKSITQSLNHPIESPTIIVSTMDTTSHNFTWQTFTFGGQAGSCILNDVAIIDDNIWAVGEIYLLDSIGQPDPTRYNLITWSGTSWQIKRVPYYYQGQPLYNPIQSIFSFSPDDIWFCGNGIIHWDGTQYIPISISSIWGPHQMNKIWGTSSNDLYVVGNNGNIAHYQNGYWSRIESGTDLNINDICGAYDEKTNQYEILAPAANVLQSLDRDLLSINSNSVEHLNTSPVNGTLRTAWFIPERIYFIGGGGIYKKVSLADSLWEIKHKGLTNYSTNRIRGLAINDIVLTGGGGEILHYNGYDFKSYLSQTQINGNYYSIDIKNNKIVAVGIDNPKAVITVGKRID